MGRSEFRKMIGVWIVENNNGSGNKKANKK